MPHCHETTGMMARNETGGLKNSNTSDATGGRDELKGGFANGSLVHSLMRRELKNDMENGDPSDLQQEANCRV